METKHTKSGMFNNETVTVSLNQAEQKVVDSLPEATRPSVIESLLTQKLNDEIGRMRRRTEFGCKVSELGGVSVSGLGQKYPVTLYPDQWAMLLSKGAEIQAFIAANKEPLAAALANAPNVRKARKANQKPKLAAV